MKRRIEVLLALVVLNLGSALVFCQETNEVGETHLTQPDSDPDGKHYFPPVRRDLAIFTKYLKAMGEPSLLALATDKTAEQYRFLYVPTFSKPISYRAFIENSNHYLQVRRLNGVGGYHPGTIELTAKVELTDPEYRAIVRSTDSPDVRNPISEMQAAAFASLDGTQWVLEILKDGQYHVAKVQSPDGLVDLDPESKKAAEEFARELGIDFPDLKSFVQACLIFVELAEVPFPERHSDGR